MPPKISVIIPIYNTPEVYLRKCLSAVTKQTMRELEIIIVDDCGSDSAAYNLAASFCKRDDRVRLLQTPHNTGTAAEPRNIGMREAAGEYIFFCDDDDFPDRNLCEVAYNAATQYGDAGVDMVVFDIREKGGKADGDHWIPARIPFNRVFSRRDTDGIISEYVGDVVWNKLFRREFLIDNDLYCFPTRAYDDRFLSWCAAIAATRVVAIRDVLHTHVHRPAQRTASGQSQRGKIDDAFTVYEAMRERFNRLGQYDDVRYDVENSMIASVMYDLMRERDEREFALLLAQIQRELLSHCLLAEEQTPIKYYHNEYFKRDVLFMRDCSAADLWRAIHG